MKRRENHLKKTRRKNHSVSSLMRSDNGAVGGEDHDGKTDHEEGPIDDGLPSRGRLQSPVNERRKDELDGGDGHTAEYSRKLRIPAVSSIQQ